VPTVGEKAEVGDTSFEILAATPTKIDRVGIMLREDAPEEPADDAGSRDDQPQREG
jgi:CBS domain containing-hemolysin-like protein